MNPGKKTGQGATETLSPALPASIEEAAEDLLRTCCERKLRIATAESCTGGLLASLLTDVEGASHAFERGFVVYSKAAKCELLGLTRACVETCGAVSRDVAVAMAEGAIKRSHADIALAVTGYAGEAPEGEEAGLVHLACAVRNGGTIHKAAHFGDIGRGPIRIGTLGVALDMMRNVVGKGAPE